MKVNVDELKEGFVSQTMLMAQMKTSINEMKGSIEDLQVGLGFTDRSSFVVLLTFTGMCMLM